MRKASPRRPAAQLFPLFVLLYPCPGPSSADGRAAGEQALTSQVWGAAPGLPGWHGVCEVLGWAAVVSHAKSF